jgi:hypothetical protein
MEWRHVDVCAEFGTPIRDKLVRTRTRRRSVPGAVVRACWGWGDAGDGIAWYVGPAYADTLLDDGIVQTRRVARWSAARSNVLTRCRTSSPRDGVRRTTSDRVTPRRTCPVNPPLTTVTRTSGRRPVDLAV